jgi:hypothetical protein
MSLGHREQRNAGRWPLGPALGLTDRGLNFFQPLREGLCRQRADVRRVRLAGTPSLARERR